MGTDININSREKLLGKRKNLHVFNYQCLMKFPPCQFHNHSVANPCAEEIVHLNSCHGAPPRSPFRTQVFIPLVARVPPQELHRAKDHCLLKIFTPQSIKFLMTCATWYVQKSCLYFEYH